MHPLTPQGPQQPNSPACNAPMTPISHHGGPNTPGGPVTPGGEFASAQNPQSGPPPQNAPMTPLTNPLTPGGNPHTPGPATPVAPTNSLADPDAPLSNQNMPPCSPMTPQGAMSQQGFPTRPDAPLTPSTPNGQQMNGPNGPPNKMGILPDGFDLSQIIPQDQGMGNSGGNPPMHPNTQNHLNYPNSYGGPRMAHPGWVQSIFMFNSSKHCKFETKAPSGSESPRFLDPLSTQCQVVVQIRPFPKICILMGY